MSTVTPVVEKHTSLEESTKAKPTKKKPKSIASPESNEKRKNNSQKKTVKTARKKAEQTSQHNKDKGQTQAQTPSEGKNQRLGRIGEDMACYYLSDKGITILERNWKCSRGEADIIAEEEGTLVFIEVKTRSEDYPGLPEYAVTKQKRARYENVAISYLSKNERPSGRVRFDVIAIRMTGENQCMLRHHRDAFASGE